MVEDEEQAPVGEAAPEEVGAIGGSGRHLLVRQAELAQEGPEGGLGTEEAQIRVELAVGEAGLLPPAPVDGERAGADALRAVQEGKPGTAVEGAGGLLVQGFQGFLTVREEARGGRQPGPGRDGAVQGALHGNTLGEQGPGAGELGVVQHPSVDEVGDLGQLAGRGGRGDLASHDTADHAAGGLPGPPAGLAAHARSDGSEYRTDGAQRNRIQHPATPRLPRPERPLGRPVDQP